MNNLDLIETLKQDYSNYNECEKVFQEVSGGITLPEFLDRFENYIDEVVLDECLNNQNSVEGMESLWTQVISLYKKKNMLFRILGNSDTEN